MKRFFINPNTIHDDHAIISGTEARHIRKVLRLKQGADVMVFDGNGNEYEAVITTYANKQIEVRLGPQKTIKTDLNSRLIVAQALLKDRKMDILIRQLTELGLTHWIPFNSSRSVPTPSADRFHHRIERWQKIATESLKQCRRATPPTITPLCSFDEALSSAADCDLKFIFWEEATQPIPTIPPTGPLPAASRIFIMTGPEGGFSKTEYDQALAAGFIGASLGPRILKAETAPIAACAIIQYLFGDIGTKNLDKPPSIE